MTDSARKVVVIGAHGFVGRNIVNGLSQQPGIDLHYFSRTPNSNRPVVDLANPLTWLPLVDLQPDILIDATGYGVVKDQTDLTAMYAINYLEKIKFAHFLFERLPTLFWVQIGTAFEYGLEQISLMEDSYCLPKTHYGISKLMFSTYLQQVIQERYCILRPFAMFGEWEADSKLIPLLILAQKHQKAIDLSTGSQRRDYFYVGDLVALLVNLIQHNKLAELEGHVLNVGSGRTRTLLELSEVITQCLPHFDPSLWRWGVLPQREGETTEFYNASTKAAELSFTATPLETALRNTINHYVNQLTP